MLAFKVNFNACDFFSKFCFTTLPSIDCIKPLWSKIHTGYIMRAMVYPEVDPKKDSYSAGTF